MQSNSVDSRGFGQIVAILIIVVLIAAAGVGVYVYNRTNTKDQNSQVNSNGTSNNSNNNTDPYSGWKTATLSSPQLSFRYPSDWAVTATSDGKNIEVKSPSSDGHYLTVSLIVGKSQDVNLNFLGNAPGTKLVDLTVDGRMLYLVAQTSGTNGALTGLGLATTAGGADTSFGIIDPEKINHMTMVASLLPVTPTASDSGTEYSIETYTSHHSHQDILKIFKSLSGDLPGR